MQLALARKYRPQNFLEVIGQDPIVTTLKNAIESGHLHHAYLFCGVRGVGKTSLARILAKSINCLKGASITPCQECEICKTVTAGNSLDVIEIDGASNNSVDDVRELREQVKFLPTSARYKIIIIDEVHMLSTAAFNALLKTLEEPPAHVIFIFATTEAHKLPITILSRCQKYDFRKLTTVALRDHLTNLSKKESIAVDAGALTVIAQCAQGSVRDALSLLDQVAASNTNNKVLSEKEVRDLLGLADRLLVLGLTEALVKADLNAALEKFAEIDARGLDLKLFTEDMLAMFRNLILKKATGNLPSDVSPSEVDFINALNTDLDLSLLLNQSQILFKGIEELSYTELPKTVFEILLVKLVHAGSMIGLVELVDSIKNKRPEMAAKVQTHPLPASFEHSAKPRIGVVQPQCTPLPSRERGEEKSTQNSRAANWYELVQILTREKPPLGGMLREAKPLTFSEAGIEIAFAATSPSKSLLIERKASVETMIAAHFGKPVPFTISDITDEKKKF